MIYEIEKLKPRKILVTGATGFIGKAIVRVCLDDGFDVVPTGNSERLERDWPNYVRADLTVPNALSSHLKDVDCIVHSAGLAHQFNKLKADLFHKVNVDAVEYAALSAVQAGIKHFILISSVAVYGDAENSNEESPCNPSGAYATSKLEGERRAIEICKAVDMRLTILRPATVFGEGDTGNVLRLIQMIKKGRFVWIGDGSNRKSLIHVNDLARACLAVIKSAGKGVKTYNVSFQPYTMREIVEVISEALNQPVPKLSVPSWLVLTPLKAASKLSQRFEPVKTSLEKWLSEDIFDGRKFEKDFDFQSTVNLKDGLKREIEWFRKSVAQ